MVITSVYLHTDKLVLEKRLQFMDPRITQALHHELQKSFLAILSGTLKVLSCLVLEAIKPRLILVTTFKGCIFLHEGTPFCLTVDLKKSAERWRALA
jgi:hypothetical protein